MFTQVHLDLTHYRRRADGTWELRGNIRRRVDLSAVVATISILLMVVWTAWAVLSAVANS